MSLFYDRVKRNIPKLMRFGAVGMIGATINFTVYYVASGLAHLGMNWSAIGAFIIAVINNYVLNHIWTFKVENDNNPINQRQFISYLIGNIQGLVINLIVLNLVVVYAGINFNLFGQAMGIVFGMLFNFIFAKKFVFKTQGGNGDSD